MPNPPFDNIETRYLRDVFADLQVSNNGQVVGTDLTATIVTPEIPGGYATAAQGALADTSLQPGDIGETVQGIFRYLDYAEVQAATIPVWVEVIEVLCKTAPFMLEGSRHKLRRLASEPAYIGKVQSGDGTWWGIYEDVWNPLMFGALGPTATNDQPIIQSMIDTAPASQKRFVLTEKHPISSAVLLSGTSDNKTGIILEGSGSLTLASGVATNVLEITSGAGYRVRGVGIVGNKGTVTPSGTDLSYRQYNGIYAGANASKTLKDVEISGCDISSCAYVGLMVGSGPVQPANVGPGIDNIRIFGNAIHNNEVGLAGGVQREMIVSGNNLYDNDIYGILVDIDSKSCVIEGNAIKHLSVLGSINAGIFVYNADDVAVSGNTVIGGKTGILASTGAGSISVSGNAVSETITSGIVITNSIKVSVVANTVRAAGQWGIYISVGAVQFIVSDNVVADCVYDGIMATAVSTGVISGNMCGGNRGSGIRLLTTTWLTVANNNCLNNNVLDGDVVSSGIRVGDSTRLTVAGNHCHDSGGAPKQNYGILEEGTSNQNTYAANDLTNNKTANKLLVGAANMVMPNGVGDPNMVLPGSLIQLGNGAAGAPAYAFSADATTGVYRTSGGSWAVAVGGVIQFLVSAMASAVNRVNIRGGVAGQPAEMFVNGETNGSMRLASSGTGVVDILSNGSLRIAATSRGAMLVVPTYADNAAAIAGGLVANDIYKTATGEIRVRV